jgi:hypothetical protein
MGAFAISIGGWAEDDPEHADPRRGEKHPTLAHFLLSESFIKAVDSPNSFLVM